IFGDDLPGHARQVFVHLRECDAMLETPDADQPGMVATNVAVGFLEQSHRYPDVFTQARERRHDADDAVWLAIERYRLADDAWIRRVLALPVARRQKHDPLRAVMIVFGAQPSSNDRRNAKQREQVRGCPTDTEPHRKLAASQSHVAIRTIQG